MPDLAASDELAKLLAKMVAKVWKEKGTDPNYIDPVVTQLYAEKLWKGVETGYGKKLSSLEYNSIDAIAMQHLQENVYQFAGAKNYAQLKELTEALLNEDGSIKSRAQFIEDALKINNTQSKQYLSAEYELAVAGGQMASKWQGFSDNDILEFDAIIDNQTTALCNSLNGTRLLWTHPFWNKFYPPNHFGCRSTVRVVYGGSMTPPDTIPTATIPTMFQTNLAKDGLIFPINHPFFKDIPKKVLENAVKYLPYNTQFRAIDHTGLGTVREHLLLDKSSKDYNTVSIIAFQLSKEGTTVDIMPNFNSSKDRVRSIILADAKKNKWPDLRINGKLVEVEEVKKGGSLNTIKNAIRNGSHQADHVVVVLNDSTSKNSLDRIVNSKFKDHKNLQQITFKQSNGIFKTYDRP